MKPFKALFEQYTSGKLPDDKVTEMNRQLVDIYFQSPEDLNKEELEYTEDLIFDLYASRQLNDTYTKEFSSKLGENESLRRKYDLLKNITIDAIKGQDKKLHQTIEENVTDEKEENELRAVLQEVIEQVQMEKEEAKAGSFESLSEKVKVFFNSLIPEINFSQPQVRYALVAVSVVLIAVVVWVSIEQGKNDRLAQNENSGKILNERTNKLLAANFAPSPHFSYVSSRSVQPTSVDTLNTAAKTYNAENYDSCILILNKLVKHQSFTDQDNMSKIYFYLGNCYLAIAFNNNEDDKIDLSIDSFKKISKNTDYYLPSQWYSSLALIKKGEADKAINILNDLIKQEYYRSGQVVALKDSLVKYKTSD